MLLFVTKVCLFNAVLIPLTRSLKEVTLVMVAISSKKQSEAPATNNDDPPRQEEDPSTRAMCPMVLVPVGLPNLGNTCFMNSGMQLVWRALIDFFIVSISQNVKPQSSDAELTTPRPEPAASLSAVTGRVPSMLELLRSHIEALASAQGVSMGAVIARASLKHISLRQSYARSAMDGGGATEGEVDASSPGLLSVIGELFLRDIANDASAMKRKAKGKGSSARISAIKEVLASENERFVDWDQHDSHELIMCLVNAISMRFNEGTGVQSSSYEAIDERKHGEDEDGAARRWWGKVCAKESSFITKMFRCLTRTKTVCGKCGKVSLNFDPTMEVHISLDDAALDKASQRRKARLAAALGMSGERPSALDTMLSQLKERRAAEVAGTNLIKEDHSDSKNANIADANSDDEASEKPKDDDSVSGEHQGDNQSGQPAAGSTMSKKDQRALKKAKKAQEKHERDLKKLKLDAKKNIGKQRSAKAGGRPVMSRCSDDDEDDGTTFLEDLLYTQLTHSTEVEGFKCEGCGAISASTPPHSTPTSSTTSSKFGGKKNAASAKVPLKKGKAAQANEVETKHFATATSCSSSSATTVTREHTHYPPFLIVHMLRFDFEGNKIRTPVRLSTRNEHVLHTTTNTISPTPSALLAVPPRPSTSQLEVPHSISEEEYEEGNRLWGAIEEEEEEEGLDNHCRSKGGSSESLYEVVGVVRHHGRTLSYGHYTSSVKAVDLLDKPLAAQSPHGSSSGDSAAAQWYLCDDDDITSERVGCSDSSVSWKGGDRDAYIVLLRSVNFRYDQSGPMGGPTSSKSNATGDDDGVSNGPAAAASSHL